MTMFKLWATIRKDMRILTRDKVGLTLMFLMPVVLVVVITAVQNSTFELVNDNRVPLLLCNRDTGVAGRQLADAVSRIGMFELKQVTVTAGDQEVKERMHARDALIALIIPADYSEKTMKKARNIASRALNEFGIAGDSLERGDTRNSAITVYYHPVLQQSFRASVLGALRSALQLVESRQIVRSLYFSINEKELPPSLENEIVNDPPALHEQAVSRDGARNIPNASQHNVPAWTIFAMFFVVISLGSSVVREKMNGSFVRLKTLPTSYLVALASKEITYLAVTLLQAALIFAIGAWLFPYMSLPALNLPADIAGLFFVSLICGWCAVSYAICIGVFAHTQEQANGFGAVSIVIMAAIGGLLVPSFAMPQSFQVIMKLSPLHWCLESYYGLFLEGGGVRDILVNIIPLLLITVLLQLLAIWRLKTKNFI